MSENEEKKTTQYRFDLSDGFGKEDIGGILIWIWSFIKRLLIIIFYPYVWIFRMITRAIAFIKTKDDNNLLTDEQKRFMESLPMFFILTGLFTGILLGLLVWIGAGDTITKFLESLDLDKIIEVIGSILGFILEVILWIIGIGTDANGNERFGIVDIIRVFFEFLVSIITEDPVLLFIGVSLIGIIGVIIWIAISETGIVSAIFERGKSIYTFGVLLPRRIYDRLDDVFVSINSKVSGFIIGEERLNNRVIAFHKKVTKFSLGLGIYTIIMGLLVIASQKITNEVALVGFTILILLALGFGVGFIELWVIVTILDLMAKGKYTKEPGEKETITSQ